VRAERDAPAAPIPADWTPSLAGIAEAKKRGFDPVDIAEGFKLHYQKTGKGMANWDAAFVAWCRRQTEFDRARQGGLPMAVQGGGTAPAAAAAPVWSETIAGQVATVEAWVAETPELAVHLQAARTTLRSQISEADYHAWLLPMALAEVADGEVTMTLPTLFKCDWVRANYADRVLAAWRAEIPTIERVEFLVRAPPAAATG
jgi:hypothetical protein